MGSYVMLEDDVVQPLPPPRVRVRVAAWVDVGMLPLVADVCWTGCRKAEKVTKADRPSTTPAIDVSCFPST